MNGGIEYSPDTTAPYLEGTRATHICDPGFILNGTVSRTCQGDGFFGGSQPSCEGKLYCKLHVG